VYFDQAEEIMVAHGGRPHWGKLHSREHGYLAEVYPRFADFLAVREKTDPDRVFANNYTRWIFGA